MNENLLTPVHAMLASMAAAMREAIGPRPVGSSFRIAATRGMAAADAASAARIAHEAIDEMLLGELMERLRACKEREGERDDWLARALAGEEWVIANEGGRPDMRRRFLVNLAAEMVASGNDHPFIRAVSSLPAFAGSDSTTA